MYGMHVHVPTYMHMLQPAAILLHTNTVSQQIIMVANHGLLHLFPSKKLFSMSLELNSNWIQHAQFINNVIVILYYYISATASPDQGKNDMLTLL